MLKTYLSDRLDKEPDLPQVLFLTWQGNSMVEGEPHKLSVVSSILTPATMWRLPLEITCGLE